MMMSKSLLGRLAAFLPLVLVGALLLAGCGGAVSAGAPLGAQAVDGENPRVINVSGVGKATAAPDVAHITLGVEARNEDAAAAVADATERMQAVMGVLEARGIPESDVQTVVYRMYLEQVPPEGRPTPGQSSDQQVVERYVVTNQVRLAVRDLDAVGEILQEVLTAGANSVADIAFAVEDTSALRREARDAAIADARAKADQLADGLGATVGVVHSVSEYGGAQPLPTVRDVYGLGGGGVPIAAGELAVSVEIQVSFLIAE